MHHPSTSMTDAAPGPAAAAVRAACVVAGCPCTDARIVSRRRAAFHAALARRRGETADRTIVPEPGWSLARLLGDRAAVGPGVRVPTVGA